MSYEKPCEVTFATIENGLPLIPVQNGAGIVEGYANTECGKSQCRERGFHVNDKIAVTE